MEGIDRLYNSGLYASYMNVGYYVSTLSHNYLRIG